MAYVLWWAVLHLRQYLLELRTKSWCHWTISKSLKRIWENVFWSNKTRLNIFVKSQLRVGVLLCDAILTIHITYSAHRGRVASSFYAPSHPPLNPSRLVSCSDWICLPGYNPVGLVHRPSSSPSSCHPLNAVWSHLAVLCQSKGDGSIPTGGRIGI